MSKRLGSNWGMFGSGIEEMGSREKDMSKAVAIVKLRMENTAIL